jgi:hypothetical protein
VCEVPSLSDAIREAAARLLPQVEQPSRYVGCEWNAIDPARTAQPYRAVLAYPDVYDVGMANQAIQILYATLNALEGVTCERVFVPWKDMADAMRRAGVPLYALESFDPVREFDLLGITLPHELCYTRMCWSCSTSRASRCVRKTVAHRILSSSAAVRARTTLSR